MAAGGAGDEARSLRPAAAATVARTCSWRYSGRAETERERGRRRAPAAGRGGRWRGLNAGFAVAATAAEGLTEAEAAVSIVADGERMALAWAVASSRGLVGGVACGCCGGGCACVVCGSLMPRGMVRRKVFIGRREAVSEFDASYASSSADLFFSPRGFSFF